MSQRLAGFWLLAGVLLLGVSAVLWLGQHQLAAAARWWWSSWTESTAEHPPAPKSTATGEPRSPMALGSLVVGAEIPDFTLKDVDGAVVHLHECVGQRPLVIEFGSFT